MDSAVSCAKTPEPIEMQFELWTRVHGPNEEHIAWGAHRRHLGIRLNRPCMCGGNATFCQITLTTLLSRIAVLAYTYVAYCYRRISVVCRSVTIVNPAITTEPIEMPFGFMGSGGPKHRTIQPCIKRGSRSPSEWEVWRGASCRPLQSIWTLP